MCLHFVAFSVFLSLGSMFPDVQYKKCEPLNHPIELQGATCFLSGFILFFSSSLITRYPPIQLIRERDLRGKTAVNLLFAWIFLKPPNTTTAAELTVRDQCAS